MLKKIKETADFILEQSKTEATIGIILGTGLGVGFSYRLGYYQTSEFKDNFGIQLKLAGF